MPSRIDDRQAEMRGDRDRIESVQAADLGAHDGSGFAAEPLLQSPQRALAFAEADDLLDDDRRRTHAGDAE